MLDPSNMYPESFHPVDIKRSRDRRRTAKGYSRTQRPTRYLLVGLGHARQYDPARGPRLDMPRRVGDKPAPEHGNGKELRDPFPMDVYYLADIVRTHYIKVCVFILLEGIFP
jgi:hypothetical protein